MACRRTCRPPSGRDVHDPGVPGRRVRPVPCPAGAARAPVLVHRRVALPLAVAPGPAHPGYGAGLSLVSLDTACGTDIPHPVPAAEDALPLRQPDSRGPGEADGGVRRPASRVGGVAGVGRAPGADRARAAPPTASPRARACVASRAASARLASSASRATGPTLSKSPAGRVQSAVVAATPFRCGSRSARRSGRLIIGVRGANHAVRAGGGGRTVSSAGPMQVGSAGLAVSTWTLTA